IIAQWKVGLDGKVMSSSIASSTMGNRSVESCIARVIKRMRFEKPDGGICIINYPFVFSGI
ncbi:MAG: AgmX/PglI C-terminal domain-containing protein, partial [Persicimonas sp.]